MYKYLDIEKETFQKILIENCKQFPLPNILDVHFPTFNSICDYLRFTKSTQSHNLISAFFEDVGNALIGELYFPNEIKAANKEILPHLGNLTKITDAMSEEEKLAVLQLEFDRLYDPRHPLRNRLETLDSVEVVRTIRQALQKK